MDSLMSKRRRAWRRSATSRLLPPRSPPLATAHPSSVFQPAELNEAPLPLVLLAFAGELAFLLVQAAHLTVLPGLALCCWRDGDSPLGPGGGLGGRGMLPAGKALLLGDPAQHLIDGARTGKQSICWSHLSHAHYHGVLPTAQCGTHCGAACCRSCGCVGCPAWT